MVSCLFLQNQHKAYEKTDYLEWWIMWNDKLFYLYFSNPQNVKWDNRDMWNETIETCEMRQ
jgi:murein L,D-transpeptidase YafK